MAFQVGSLCYQTNADALSAMASQMFGNAVTTDGVYSYFSYVSGESIITRTSLNTEISITPTLQPCGLVDAAQAYAYSSAVMLVLLIAWKFKLAGRAFMTNDRDGS
jgi:hypothetical protein